MSSYAAAASSRDLSFAEVVFAEATPRQRTLAWELNGVSWAPPMSLQTYVDRETALSQTPLTANGGTKYLVLYLKGDPDAIVSACEVTKKEVLVADADGCRVAEGYAIASVFTPPQYRGHGLASHLLKEVQKLVDQTAECGALYSDIGRSFYTKLGWKDYSSQQLVFHLEKDFQAPAKVDDVALLTETEITTLCAKDIDVLKRKFQQLADTKDGKTCVTFLPAPTQFSWHFARVAFMAKALRGVENVEHHGAQTSDGSSWIYWDHDLREKKLKIMRIVTQESDSREKREADIEALLKAALAEASAWGLPKMGVWSPGRETSAAAMNIWHEVGSTLALSFESRSADSIPSLRWKGGKDVSEIVWENNEYFAWC